MILTINKKDYQFEYSIEASLYSDCTDKLLKFMYSFAGDDNQGIIAATSEMPSVALTMFYAGLLEHHGLYGDGSVSGMKDAKELLKQYFKENPKESYYSFLMKAIDQMGDDGFFQRIGLDEMIKAGQQEAQKGAENKKTETGHGAK